MRPAGSVSEENINTNMPTTLKAWRSLILDWVLRGMLVFWLLVLVWRVLATSIFPVPTESPSTTPILIGIYLISALVTLAITFLPQLGYKLRAAIFLALLFFYGMADLFFQGFTGEGRLFLLAFVALVAVFFDLRRSIFALALSFFSMALITILQAVGVLPNLSLLIATNMPDYVKIINGSLIFIVLSILVVLSITYLINSLENSLAQTQKEKDFATAVF